MTVQGNNNETRVDIADYKSRPTRASSKTKTPNAIKQSPRSQLAQLSGVRFDQDLGDIHYLTQDLNYLKTSNNLSGIETDKRFLQDLKEGKFRDIAAARILEEIADKDLSVYSSRLYFYMGQELGYFETTPEIPKHLIETYQTKIAPKRETEINDLLFDNHERGLAEEYQDFSEALGEVRLGDIDLLGEEFIAMREQAIFQTEAETQIAQNALTSGTYFNLDSIKSIEERITPTINKELFKKLALRVMRAKTASYYENLELKDMLGLKRDAAIESFAREAERISKKPNLFITSGLMLIATALGVTAFMTSQESGEVRKNNFQLAQQVDNLVVTGIEDDKFYTDYKNTSFARVLAALDNNKDHRNVLKILLPELERIAKEANQPISPDYDEPGITLRDTPGLKPIINCSSDGQTEKKLQRVSIVLTKKYLQELYKRLQEDRDNFPYEEKVKKHLEALGLTINGYKEKY